jgi:hypothetical protein
MHSDTEVDMSERIATPDLLLCPFCGAGDLIRGWEPEGWNNCSLRWIQCSSCGGTANSPEVWNTRSLATAAALPREAGWRVEGPGAMPRLECGQHWLDPSGPSGRKITLVEGGEREWDMDWSTISFIITCSGKPNGVGICGAETFLLWAYRTGARPEAP